VGLGVPYIDDEQHRRALCSGRAMAQVRPRLYVLPAERLLAPAHG
jgi:hypothetical protein